MTKETCDRCGTVFDTDREGATPGADTTRCPSCGAPAGGDGDGDDDDDGDKDAVSVRADDDGETVATVDTHDGRIVIELHIHVHQ